MSGCGYYVIGHFTLPEDAWQIEYYGPLEKRIQGLRTKHIDDPKALSMHDKEQREVDIYKRSCK